MKYILILMLLLSGCSSMTITRDVDGRVYKVDTMGNIECRVNETEVYANSKAELLKDVVSINALKE